MLAILSVPLVFVAVLLVWMFFAYMRSGVGASMTVFAQTSTGPSHGTSWMFPGREEATPLAEDDTQLAVIVPPREKQLPPGIRESQ